MVKTIYLSSFNERAGKTLIAIGLLQKIKKEGYKVKYVKSILIGAMDVPSAMKYVRQSVSAACINGFLKKR